MNEIFSRTRMLYGDMAMENFSKARVAVFGIGGVGGHVAEALVRSGIGNIDIIDNDIVSLSNINRQIIADFDSVGRLKVDVMEERIKKINPLCNVIKHNVFVLPENADIFDFSAYNYVVDAIDTVSGKISIIKECGRLGVPVISCMGAGNKLNPLAFEIADIYKTSVCPLAKAMRRLCKENSIKKLKVLYSKEEPVIINIDTVTEECTSKKRIPASNAVVPAAAGLIIAGEVLNDLSSD